MKNKVSKPPLGIMNKSLWEEERLSDLNDAISRYEKSDFDIPSEWIEERDNLSLKNSCALIYPLESLPPNMNIDEVSKAFSDDKIVYYCGMKPKLAGINQKVIDEIKFVQVII